MEMKNSDLSNLNFAWWSLHHDSIITDTIWKLNKTLYRALTRWGYTYTNTHITVYDTYIVEVLHFPANFDHMCWLLNMSDEKGVHLYGVYNFK